MQYKDILVCSFLLINLYPSRICVVCVAPSHVLFEPAPGLEILSVDFHFGRTDRTKNQVFGKTKNKWFEAYGLRLPFLHGWVILLTSCLINSMQLLIYCMVGKAVCNQCVFLHRVDRNWTWTPLSVKLLAKEERALFFTGIWEDTTHAWAPNLVLRHSEGI